MSEAAADGGQGGPLVFLVVGEPSGDQLGAKLMAALKAETGAAEPCPPGQTCTTTRK